MPLRIWVLAGPNISLFKLFRSISCFRKTQEGCGGPRGENPGAFPKAGPIFQQPFFLAGNAQTLAEIAFRAARKSVKNFPAASEFAGKLFQQGISDSHSLLEFSDCYPCHYSGDWSEYVNVIGVISEPFACELR